MVNCRPIIGLLGLLTTGLLQAQPVTFEGTASIVAGNVAEARENAIRNALAEAARQGSVTISTATGIRSSQVEFDQSIVRSAAQVHRHEVIGEERDGEIYRVQINADLGLADKPRPKICREGYTKRLLIGGFPLEHPEQLLSGELIGYAYLTAREIAKRMGPSPAVLVDYRGAIMVHPSRPETVRNMPTFDAQTWSRVRTEAENHRAQYLLVGEYRSLELNKGRNERALDLDVLLLDAFSGSCVARTRFSEVASGSVVLPWTIKFGSPEHMASGLGRAYDKLLKRVAEWAEATASCQPFGARVIKSEGKKVYIDAGAEQGVGLGNTFSMFKVRSMPLSNNADEVLGIEKTPRGEAKVTAVYPRFSVVEMLSGGSAGLTQGDEAYSR